MAAEDTAADLAIAAGQLRDVMRHHAAAVGALVAWHGARGTPKEQAAADMLLAALAAQFVIDGLRASFLA
jgi:hypothetical protein